ncbi:MAG: hypothetical protein JSW09_10780 [Pseudomonadota bacterium]|nr:MAG: hypothetical protein JSW09_10780 [Pseudomonadota bacterium]
MQHWQRLVITFSLLPAALWAHPFGHHETGFVMLDAHVHEELVWYGSLIAVVFFAAVAAHLMRRWLSAPGPARRVGRSQWL